MGGPHVPEKMRDMLALYRTKRQSEPVSLDEASGRWQVFGYRDGVTVATDAKRFSNDLSAFIPDHEELRTFTKGNFQAMDDPRHRQMRSLVSQGFTPKFVQGLAPGSNRSPPNCSTGSPTGAGTASTWSPTWRTRCRSPSSPR